MPPRNASERNDRKEECTVCCKDHVDQIVAGQEIEIRRKSVEKTQPVKQLWCWRESEDQLQRWS